MLINGDALKKLKTLKAESVDACVCDPPYGIAYDDHRWDRFTNDDAFRQFTAAWGKEVLRVLRPGAHLVAFGAARTIHLLGGSTTPGGLELAGFVFEGYWQWLYGTGVPMGRTREGQTRERPAYEPMAVFHKPPVRQLLWKPHPSFVVRGDTSEPITPFQTPETQPRFYVPKPSVAEMEAGCDDLPAGHKKTAWVSKTERRNLHPMVKPVTLMRVLVRRASPSGGVVLDPFMGSGSTGMACVYEHRDFIGVEREPSYFEVAKRRIAYTERMDALALPLEIFVDSPDVRLRNQAAHKKLKAHVEKAMAGFLARRT